MNSKQSELFPHEPSDTVVINQRCLLRTQDGVCLVLVSGIPLWHFAVDDAMSKAHAIVSLVDQGWASQVEVAQAFDCATRTVRRLVERFDGGGLPALGRRAGYPAGRPRAPAGRAALVERLKVQGLSNRSIATHIGVTEKAVRNTLRRLGWSAPDDPTLAFNACPSASVPDPGVAPGPSTAVEEDPSPPTMDKDPFDRRMDRLLAFLGMLDDAAPLFASAKRVPRAGVLLAIPSLLATGVLDAARQIYGTLGPAFYGLRTSVVALLLLALLRIKRPEALKEHSPADLGHVLGLDRAPEVKTLRRKLARLAAAGRAADFGHALAQHRFDSHGSATGFLLIDGHVRVYHGRHSIPYAHVARMRIARPATTDYWVNDAAGEPVFVITSEANAALTKMLMPILSEIRRLAGERRVTIVFDRGGWSPKLFQRILKDFDILTYRKFRSRRVPARCFRKVSAKIDGREVSYTLADQEVRLLGGRLRLRQVTRLMENGHQTPIITSRRDLRSVEVAYRMFERWRQENFFKYLREEYALDALIEHAVAPADPERDVPNPAWFALSKQIASVRATLIQLSSLYGKEALDNVEAKRPTMRGFKIANAKARKEIGAAVKSLARLLQRRADVPRRVPVKQVVAGPVVKLAPERQHLANIFKMVAYQAESDLVQRIRPVYRRAEQEGRTLVQSALSSAADIEVTDTELRVALAPLSSPHRSRAVAALCAELETKPVCFPGTRLRMRFRVG